MFSIRKKFLVLIKSVYELCIRIVRSPLEAKICAFLPNAQTQMNELKHFSLKALFNKSLSKKSMGVVKKVVGGRKLLLI